MYTQYTYSPKAIEQMFNELFALHHLTDHFGTFKFAFELKTPMGGVNLISHNMEAYKEVSKVLPLDQLQTFEANTYYHIMRGVKDNLSLISVDYFEYGGKDSVVICKFHIWFERIFDLHFN